MSSIFLLAAEPRIIPANKISAYVMVIDTSKGEDDLLVDFCIY